jgi:hypothetical protein
LFARRSRDRAAFRPRRNGHHAANAHANDWRHRARSAQPPPDPPRAPSPWKETLRLPGASRAF